MSVLESPEARIHTEWRNRVRAEYISAAVTARVLHLAIACGLPRELLATAQRIVGDELDHAELSDQARVQLGDVDETIALDVRSLLPGDPRKGVLQELVDHTLQSFCLGETLAVPLFAEMRKHASHPAVMPVLTRVLRDEAVHRAFGWDLLDALLDLDPDGIRQHASEHLPTMLAGFRRSYHDIPDRPPPTGEELAASLLSHRSYQQIFRQTVHGVIVPRMQARGISLDPVVDTPT